MRQVLLILPDTKKSIPSGKTLRTAGFLVSSAIARSDTQEDVQESSITMQTKEKWRRMVGVQAKDTNKDD